MGAYVTRIVPNAVSHRHGEDSVLNAIEDMQKISQDDIREEFERLLDHMRQGLNRIEHAPCASHADRLLQCVRENSGTGINCFEQMNAYRQCIEKSFQHHIDDYLRTHQNVPARPQLPIAPKHSSSLETQRKSSVLHSIRSWVKSWFH